MSAKISKSEKIRALLKEGLDVAVIAKKVGVSAPYVYQIRSKSGKKAKAPKKIGSAKSEKTNGNGHSIEVVSENSGLSQLRASLEAKLDTIREVQGMLPPSTPDNSEAHDALDSIAAKLNEQLDTVANAQSLLNEVVGASL